VTAAARARACPSDDDPLVTTYGELRRYFREGQEIREAYSQQVQRAYATSEAYVHLAWSLHDEIKRLHAPASRGKCAICETPAPCKTRRTVNDLVRHYRDLTEDDSLRADPWRLR
jgi:hypothetical protein